MVSKTAVISLWESDQLRCNIQVWRPHIILLLVVEGAQCWVVGSQTMPLIIDPFLIIAQFSWVIHSRKACLSITITAMSWFYFILYSGHHISISLPIRLWTLWRKRPWPSTWIVFYSMFSENVQLKNIRKTKKQVCIEINYKNYL